MPFERDLRADKTDETDWAIAPDPNQPRGSRMSNQDGRIGNEQLPAQIASAMAPGPDGGDEGE